MTSGFMTFITEQQQLIDYCARLSQACYIAIDTEFMREKTYYPKLCVIQLASFNPNIAIAIDMLADNLSFEPLYKLLVNPNILKVFHSARQDIEALFTQHHLFPTPLFDTQIAAMVCGFGESVSYANLVESISGHIIDKKFRYSDWSARPLSSKQIQYALEDVIHLGPVYLWLKNKLEENHRASWLEGEWKLLRDPSIYVTKPEDAWKKINCKHQNCKTFSFIKKLASFREILAQQHDVPRNRILKDQTILDLAQMKPLNLEEIRRFRAQLIDNSHYFSIDEIVSLLQEANKMESTEEDKNFFKQSKKQNINREMIELLRLLLMHQANLHEVAPKLLADKQDLELLANATLQELELHQQEKKLPLFQEWKFSLFGAQALSLRQGKTAMTMEKNKLQLISL